MSASTIARPVPVGEIVLRLPRLVLL